MLAQTRLGTLAAPTRCPTPEPQLQNDGCVTFGQSHGPVAIHISAIEDWAEPEFGPD